jgi:hypothetical protein
MFKLTSIAIAVSSIITLSACSPRPVDENIVIGPSETAFLVPLDGNTSNQAKLNSAAFLEQHKVQAKRIVIPHRILDTCPSCWGTDHQIDVPTAMLYRISRAPVTREWTSAGTTGTSASNQAFAVETNESIDFDIGATITAHIEESNTAQFLYFYAGASLDRVMDTNIRSYVGGIMAREFGSHDLEYDRAHKIEIFATARTETQEYYAKRGITIDTLGYTEGMNYHDKNIQDAINKKFQADIGVKTAAQQLAAAKLTGSARDAMAAQQQQTIHMRELDIMDTMAHRWNGSGIVPQFVITNDGKIETTVPVKVTH